MEPVKIDVKKLEEWLKPFSNHPIEWGNGKPISIDEVNNALAAIDLLSPEKKIRSRKDHIRRIAWYAAHGFGSPIKLSIKSLINIKVIEGEHQFRAALVRGDNLIKVDVVEGDLSKLITN